VSARFAASATVPAPPELVWPMLLDVRRYLAYWRARALETMPASAHDPWRLEPGGVLHATTSLFGGSQPADPTVLSVSRVEEDAGVVEVRILLPHGTVARHTVMHRPGSGELCHVEHTCEVTFPRGWYGRLVRVLARASLAQTAAAAEQLLRRVQREAVERQAARQRTLDGLRHDYRGWEVVLEEFTTTDTFIVAWRGRPLLRSGDVLELRIFPAGAPPSETAPRPGFRATWEAPPAGPPRIHLDTTAIAAVAAGGRRSARAFRALLLRALLVVAHRVHADEVVGALPPSPSEAALPLSDPVDATKALRATIDGPEGLTTAFRRNGFEVIPGRRAGEWGLIRWRRAAGRPTPTGDEAPTPPASRATLPDAGADA
jgi:hypothetical protein